MSQLNINNNNNNNYDDGHGFAEMTDDDFAEFKETIKKQQIEDEKLVEEYKQLEEYQKKLWKQLDELEKRFENIKEVMDFRKLQRRSWAIEKAMEGIQSALNVTTVSMHDINEEEMRRMEVKNKK